jgi:hypothetical protein
MRTEKAKAERITGCGVRVLIEGTAEDSKGC